MVDLERLRDNLNYIRRGRGLTFAKLAECQYIMEGIGIRRLAFAEGERCGRLRLTSLSRANAASTYPVIISTSAAASWFGRVPTADPH